MVGRGRALHLYWLHARKPIKLPSAVARRFVEYVVTTFVFENGWLRLHESGTYLRFTHELFV